MDLGSAAHAVLAEITRRGIDENLPLKPEVWEAQVPAALERYRAALPAGLSHRLPRLAYLLQVLEAFVRERVRSLVAGWNLGEFRPFAAERPVGEGAPLSLLDVAPDVRIGLRGSIDRIDVASTDDGYLLLVRDYKSSPDKFRTREAVLVGGSLQVWLYVLAVRAGIAARAAAGEPSFGVAGVLVDPLYPRDGCIDKKYYEQADEGTQPLFLYRPRGTMLEAAAHRLDTGVRPGEESPAGAIKRTKPKKNEPSRFYNNADVVSSASFNERLAQARETLRYVAAGVLRGEIEPSPLFHKRTLACRNCPFGERVCRYERGRDAPRVALNVLPRALGGDSSGGECDE
jgi:ATP-dependent helicase/DNAse subunit B